MEVCDWVPCEHLWRYVTGFPMGIIGMYVIVFPVGMYGGLLLGGLPLMKYEGGT